MSKHSEWINLRAHEIATERTKREMETMRAVTSGCRPEFAARLSGAGLGLTITPEDRWQALMEYVDLRQEEREARG